MRLTPDRRDSAVMRLYCRAFQDAYMPTETIRVMLTDDHQVVRTGLRAVLGSAKDIVVVAEAASGREAVALSGRVQPDVILMDVSMSDIDGLEATRQITATEPHPRILVLTMH